MTLNFYFFVKEMSNIIKLETTSILHVPIENYERNFTFIVNDERFETNRLVADLLSPKISKFHLSDPTINEYRINTTNKGNFNTVLSLIKFNDNTILDDELPFLVEVIENLETSTKTNFDNAETSTENEGETNISDTIEGLLKHSKFRHFYNDQITKEIDFISENMYRLTKEDKEHILTLDRDIISRIIFNDHLQIESEDSLIEMINSIYKKDRENSSLYASVLFNNVSAEKMKEFLSIILYDDIDEEVWLSLSKRLSSDIVKREEEATKKTKENQGKHQRYKNLSLKTILYSNQSFEGLIKYLQTESNIKEEIELTANNNSQPWSIFDYNNTSGTNTGVHEDAWICIGFKNHEIKPTNYTIRSGNDTDNLKSFVLEGSKDKKTWTTIDEENDISYLKENGSIHTFPIHNETHQSFKYIRLRLTGKNWNNRSMLQLTSIEFYGELF